MTIDNLTPMYLIESDAETYLHVSELELLETLKDHPIPFELKLSIKTDHDRELIDAKKKKFNVDHLMPFTTVINSDLSDSISFWVEDTGDLSDSISFWVEDEGDLLDLYFFFA